jgi:hypothetical protein
VKIYVTAVEALRKKERQRETQKTIKNEVLIEFCEIRNLVSFSIKLAQLVKNLP